MFIWQYSDTNEIPLQPLRLHLKEDVTDYLYLTVVKPASISPRFIGCARGLFISWPNRHRTDEMLQSRATPDVRVIA